MPIHGYPGGVITANPTAPTVSSASGVWTTEQQLINQSAGNWPMAATQVSLSTRFNSADSAYLSRTPTTAGNRKTWTWSGWVKVSSFPATNLQLFGTDFTSVSNNSVYLTFSSQTLALVGANSGVTHTVLVSSALYRDPSAWYHIVASVDTTQATASNRAKLYVNGVQVTALSTATYPAQNTDTSVNNTVVHSLGALRIDGSFAQFLNGYLTEINFIDGLALTPAYFGFNDSNTGAWTPRQYTGTYGTNGFYLNFSDNSGTTSTTLGKDYSGNGNNWTPNNFSVTAGAGNDSLVDSPTSYGTDTGAGGEVRGNYCTWNPIAKSAAVLLSNGNLNGSSDASLTGGCSGTIAVTSGKWYWETTIITFDGASAHGILKLPVTNNYATSEPGSYKYLSGGDVRIGDGSNVPYGASYGAGDVVGVALDLDNGKVFFSKNGVFQNSGNPVSGTNPAFSSLSGEFTAWCQDGSFTQVDTWATNFGQRPFAYTAPSGFKALCTQNLPTPTIGATSTTQANDYFDVNIYTGNGSSQSITNSGSMKPDFVWVKSRSSTTYHQLYDAVRGVSKPLFSNDGLAEGNYSPYGVTAFNSNGFTVNDITSSGYGVNENAVSYVGWQWRASNTTAVTNTAGTITSTVSANTTSGFSIVTYTGTGALGTVGHGLGVTPSMIIVKRRNSTGDWAVYNSNLSSPENNQLLLNSTAAAPGSSTFWGNQPSSSVFSVWTSATTNASGGTFVAYCFAPVAGYSAFGSYVGNGSADGPFVFTNFRPRYVMIKRTDSTSDWTIYDTSRSTYNQMNLALYANLSNAEGTTIIVIDTVSNGIKIRNSNADTNASGGTYIYACFAESPFKYALAR